MSVAGIKQIEEGGLGVLGGTAAGKWAGRIPSLDGLDGWPVTRRMSMLCGHCLVSGDFMGQRQKSILKDNEFQSPLWKTLWVVDNQMVPWGLCQSL